MKQQTETITTYALLKTSEGWVGIDPLNNPVPKNVLEEAISNIGRVLADRPLPDNTKSKKHQPIKGYVYLVSYTLNNTPMLKIGRGNKVRVKSYNHLGKANILLNKEVNCQICTEKALLREFSNGRSEYIPAFENALELFNDRLLRDIPCLT